MNFTEALAAINDKQVVTRRRWGGKVKVYLVQNRLNNISHIEVRNITNCIMYAASSEDLLATDWEIVNPVVKQPLQQLSPDEIVL
jgi:hypothetical protein